MSSKIYLIMSQEEADYNYNPEPNFLFYVKNENEAKKYVELLNKSEKTARDFLESEKYKRFIDEWMKEHPKPIPPVKPPKDERLSKVRSEQHQKNLLRQRSEEMGKYHKEFAIYNDEVSKWHNDYNQSLKDFFQENCLSKIKESFPEKYREMFIGYISGKLYMPVEFYYTEIEELT